MLLWVSLLGSLLSATPAEAVVYCGSACQSGQQQALAALFNATGGPSWKSTISTIATVAANNGWLNYTQVDARPAHCLWSGGTRTK